MAYFNGRVSVVIPCLWTEQKFFDMTVECLKTLRKDVQIIVIANNEGYATNVNAGLRAATGDYLIVSNNDIEFIQPDWLEHLLNPLKEGYDISSIRTTDADGWETEDIIEENAKFGSLWCMKRAVYETIGGLDESYGKGYFEDLDYQKRATDAGFRVAKNHAGIVEHKGKATFSVVDPDDTAFWEAREKFKRKWGEVW